MNILDRRFKYVPASKTDIRKTFERVRRQQRANEQERREKVEQLSRKRAAS